MGFYQKGKYSNSTQAKSKFRKRVRLMQKKYPKASYGQIVAYIASDFANPTRNSRANKAIGG